MKDALLLTIILFCSIILYANNPVSVLDAYSSSIVTIFLDEATITATPKSSQGIVERPSDAHKKKHKSKKWLRYMSSDM